MGKGTEPLTAAPTSLASGRDGPLPVALGFKNGVSGAHASRTMMLAELTALLGAAPASAQKDDYLRLILDENCLGKKTSSNRRLTSKHLVELYALDPVVPPFRLLRHFWANESPARPLLAFLCAFARDPLLRLSAPLVLATKVGDVLTSGDVVKALDTQAPGRFTPATRLSVAQNLASSWAQAGFLEGKLRKIRKRPVVTPVNATYALALAYLCGLRGQFILESIWGRLLDLPTAQIAALGQEASRRGWLDFRGVGGIVDIAFPALLTPAEIRGSHGPD